MLIYSMSVSVDGFIADREGAFAWTGPSDELFRFHTALVRELGGYLLGRRLYETMLVWETDSSMRDEELRAAFADVWCAIPKVVFSRTLDSVQGNARLAKASVADEVAAALGATDNGVAIGGAGLAAAQSSSASSTSCACSVIRSLSVAARHSCRRSPKTSRWTLSKPGHSARA
jgi:dihydrofolate reductase